MLQDEKDILLHAIDNTEDVLLHRAWSEEAKQRVREARRAGRKVSEMFANLYSRTGRFINKTTGKATKRFANSVKKAYNKPISSDVSTFDSHFSKPLRSIKNKNGTTTKYYEGVKEVTTTSKSLKDYVHGRKGKTKKTHSEGQYAKTFDKKGNLKSTKYYSDKQLRERGRKKMNAARERIQRRRITGK